MLKQKIPMLQKKSLKAINTNIQLTTEAQILTQGQRIQLKTVVNNEKLQE